MIIAEYNLSEISKEIEIDRAKNPIKKEKKKLQIDEPICRFTKKEKWGELERAIIKANKKPLFSRPMDLDFFIEKDLNDHIAASSISRMNQAMNKMVATEKLLSYREQGNTGVRDTGDLMKSIVVLDKNMIDQPNSFFDLDNSEILYFYIKFIEDLFRLKLEALSTLDMNKNLNEYIDYISHVKALSFYRSFVDASQFIKSKIAEYATYISFYHKNELKRIEENDIAIKMSHVERFREDFYLLIKTLSYSKETKDEIEKINNYSYLYNIIYDKMIEHSKKEFYLKSYLESQE